MPSHLTRHVFRRILANEPILHRGCQRRQQHNGTVARRNDRPPRAQPHREHGIQYAQRRTAFSLAGMFGRKQRQPAAASMDPGIETMRELEKLTRLKARLPPPEQVAEALKAYLRAQRRYKAHVPDTHATLAAQSLRYCSQYESERGVRATRHAPLLPETILTKAARMLRGSMNPLPAHVNLAKALVEYIELHAPNNLELLRSAVVTHARCLALSGSPQEALNIALDFSKKFGSAKASKTDSSPLVAHSESALVNGEALEGLDAMENQEDAGLPESLAAMFAVALRGFVSYGPREMVEPVLRMSQERGLQNSGAAHAMQEYSLGQNDFDAALYWWRARKRLQSPHKTTSDSPRIRSIEAGDASSTQQLLNWCMEHGKIEQGHQVVEELTASTPSKADWDVIFVWAAGTKRSVDEIDRMMGIMVQANRSIADRTQWRLPDNATINALVEAAISRDDPYMAERFIALGREKDIQPDAKTYVLQMDYRLRVGDVDGALIAYKSLQGLDVSSNEDVPTVNRLLIGLCNTQRHDFDTIMNVAADLSDRRARFEADTVATLSLLHLRRDERYDVIDLLNTHAYHFSSAERESIRNALVSYALDETTLTARSWDAYTILRELFDEMPRTQRTELLTHFILRRNRPDMGVHIFQNMRMHSRADTMPTIDTYVAAFLALARTRELESLEVVHNQLKLDFNVTSTTYLLNALIIAYTACGKPRFALDYWDEIALSREGPSYNSIHVALRACEKAAFGDLKAQEIWALLRKRGVELDQALWASYVAALAGNGDVGLAVKTLEEGVERGEVEVERAVVGGLLEAAPNVEKQGEVEGWARERCAEVWAEVVGVEGEGLVVDKAGMRRVKRLERGVAP